MRRRMAWLARSASAFAVLALTACPAREPAPRAHRPPIVLPSASSAEADAPVAEKPAEPPPPEEDWLADEVEGRQSRRCRLARRGRLRFTPEAEPVDDLHDSMRDTDVPREALIVAGEKADTVRVVVDELGLRLLLWVERSALLRLVVRKAAVTPAGGAASADAGVTVWPGLELELGQRQGDAVGVRFKDSELELSGTLAESAFGEVYELALPPRSTGHWLVPRTELRTGPGGAVVARALDSLSVEVLGEQGKLKRVRLAHVVGSAGRGGPLGACEAVGWVPSAAVSASPTTGIISATGQGRGWGGSNTIELPAGTPLYHAPEHGARVGVVLRSTRARKLAGGTPEYEALSVLSGWGFVRVFARAAPPGSEQR